MEGLRKWRKRPTARRDELQHAYAPCRRLPPGQRGKVMRRYRQFEQLPPDQRERMLANYRRWQQMTPQQRMEAHRRFGMGRARPQPGQRGFPRGPAAQAALPPADQKSNAETRGGEPGKWDPPR